MRKITVALALVLVVALAAPAVQGETFPDVDEDHWAYEAVEALVAAGVVEGYPDGEYKGDQTMTRYEMAMIIQRTLDNINEEFERMDQDIMYLEDDISALEDGLTAAQAEDVVAIVERMLEDHMPDMPDELTEQQAEQVTEIVEAMVAEFQDELDQIEAELGALRYVIETQTDALWAETDDIQDTIDDLEARMDELEEERTALTFSGSFEADFEHEEVVDLGCMGQAFEEFEPTFLDGFTDEPGLDLQVTGVPAAYVDNDDFEVDVSDYAHEITLVAPENEEVEVGEEGTYYEFRDITDFAQFMVDEISERVQEEPDFDAYESFEEYFTEDILDSIASDIDGSSVTAVPSTTANYLSVGGSTTFTEGYPSVAKQPAEPFVDDSGFTADGTLSLTAEMFDPYRAQLDMDILTDYNTAGIDDIEFQLWADDYEFHYAQTAEDDKEDWMQVTTDDLVLSYGQPNQVDFADFAAFDAHFEGFTAEFWDTEVFFGEGDESTENISIDYNYDFFYDGDDKADWDADEMVSVTPVPNYYIGGMQRTFNLADFELETTAVTQKYQEDWLHSINRMVAGVETGYDVGRFELGGDFALSSDYGFDDIGLLARGDASADFEGIADLSADVRWMDEDFRPIYSSGEVFDPDHFVEQDEDDDEVFDEFEDGIYPGEVAFNLRADQDLVDLLTEGYVDFSYNAGDWLAQVGGEVGLFEAEAEEEDEEVYDLTLDAMFERYHYTRSWNGITEEDGAVGDEPGTEFDFNEDMIQAGAEYTFDPVTVGLDYELSMHPGVYDDLFTSEASDGADFIEPGFQTDWDEYAEEYEEGDGIDDIQEISITADIEDIDLIDDLTLGASAGYTMITGQGVVTGDNIPEDHFADPEVWLVGGIYERDEQVIEASGNVGYDFRGLELSNELGVEMLSGKYYDYVAEQLYQNLDDARRIEDYVYDGESGDRMVISNTFGVDYEVASDVDLNFSWTEEFNRFDDDTLADNYNWQTRELSAGVEVEF